MGLELIIGEIAIGPLPQRGSVPLNKSQRLEEVDGIENLSQKGAEPLTGSRNGGREE